MSIYGILCLVLVSHGTWNLAEAILKTRPFRCDDRSRISSNRVCDGRPDCPDGSDETEARCLLVMCNPTLFSCSYGGCIPQTERCDGKVNCLDGSDELFCDINDVCTDDQFKCTVGDQCIARKLLCNGFADCEDLSDENPVICKKYNCHKLFTCTLGGCIHPDQKCDGTEDCIDGSDEANCGCESGGQCISTNGLCDDGTLQCKDALDEKINETCTNHSCQNWNAEIEELCGASLLEGACKLPPAKPGTNYIVDNCERCRPGQLVPESTRLDYSCYGDVDLDGPKSVYCKENQWLPKLPLCPDGDGEIKCPLINSPGTIKRCELKQAGWTSCDQILPVGTQVTMECRDFYEQVRGSLHITCRDDGTWSQIPLSCRLTCGIRTSASSALIVKGWDAPSNEPVPWHAALFSHENGDWKYFCGGTLIAERVVLTAGHCVWKTTTDTIKVLLASNSSNFTDQNEETQVLDVDRIELQSSYQDHEGNYGSDLALLILKDAAKMNSYVLPACVDWSNKFDITERIGEIGVIAGMGITENDTVSQTLRLVSGQVISDDTCRSKQTRDFRKYITYTSFCAGWANGTGVCNGDSGGGFLLRRPDTEVWEIQGIVSLSPRRFGKSLCDPNYHSIFTKVSVYVNWIEKVVQSIPGSEEETADSLIPNGDNVELD